MMIHPLHLPWRRQEGTKHSGVVFNAIPVLRFFIDPRLAQGLLKAAPIFDEFQIVRSSGCSLEEIAPQKRDSSHVTRLTMLHDGRVAGRQEGMVPLGFTARSLSFSIIAKKVPCFFPGACWHETCSPLLRRPCVLNPVTSLFKADQEVEFVGAPKAVPRDGSVHLLTS